MPKIDVESKTTRFAPNFFTDSLTTVVMSVISNGSSYLIMKSPLSMYFLKSHPNISPSWRTSCGSSSSEKNMPFSPFCNPSHRNCEQKSVFPVPVVPVIRYTSFSRNPPYISLSSPGMPEVRLGCRSAAGLAASGIAECKGFFSFIVPLLFNYSVKKDYWRLIPLISHIIQTGFARLLCFRRLTARRQGPFLPSWTSPDRGSQGP